MIERVMAGLTGAQQRLLLAATGEHPAGDFGWVSSNATVQMRAMNRQHALMSRRYKGGRNVYFLTPLGLAVRAALKSPPQ